MPWEASRQPNGALKCPGVVAAIAVVVVIVVVMVEWRSAKVCVHTSMQRVDPDQPTFVALPKEDPEPGSMCGKLNMPQFNRNNRYNRSSL